MLRKKLWTCRTGYVIVKITRQQAGKLRKAGSNSGLRKGITSTPKRPDRFFGSHSRLSRGPGRSFCCSKTVGTWSRLLLSSLRVNLFVPKTLCVFMLQRQTHVYYNNTRNSNYHLMVCMLLHLTLRHFHQLCTPHQLSLKSYKNGVPKKSSEHVHAQFCDSLSLIETIKRKSKFLLLLLLLLETWRRVFRKTWSFHPLLQSENCSSGFV